MDRESRAKQFAPFDALRGLHQAIRIKEFEHESVLKGDLSDEQAQNISNVLIGLEHGDIVNAVYYDGKHEYEVSGGVKLYLDENIIKIGEKKIKLEFIRRIEKYN